MAQPNLPAVTAIVVAAGASRRMGFDKLSYRLPDGRTVLETSCAALAAHPAITQLVLVCGGNRAACEAIAKILRLSIAVFFLFSSGGAKEGEKCKSRIIRGEDIPLDICTEENREKQRAAPGPSGGRSGRCWSDQRGR